MVVSTLLHNAVYSNFLLSCCFAVVKTFDTTIDNVVLMSQTRYWERLAEDMLDEFVGN